MKNILLLLLASFMAVSITTAAEPQLILVEQMTTSSNNSPSFLPIANQFNQIVNSNTEVIPMTIHMNFNPDLFWEQRKDLSNRILLYKEQNEQYPLPSFYVNGSEQVGIGGLQNKINAEKNKQSPFKMKVQFGENTDQLMLVEVKTDIDVEITSADVMFCAIIEKHIVAPNVGNSNESNFYYVTRKIDLQPTGGETIYRNDLGFAGNRFSFFIEDYWNLEEIYAIAWVQNAETKEVKQVEKVKMYDEKPTIASNTDTLSFNDENKNTSEEIEIYNSSMGYLDISEISIDNSDDFKLQHIVDETRVYPGMTKLLNVRMNTLEEGEYTANITIKSNADNVPDLVIPINAKIESSASPVITTDVNTIDFGKVSKQKTEILNITNTGKGPLVIDNIEFKDNEDGVFSILNNFIPDVEEGETFFLQVNFKPTDELPYFASMIIKSNASNESEISIPLRGEGESLEQFASIALDAESINFDKTDFVTPITRSLVIQNVGNQPLEVKNSAIENNIGSAFSFVGEKNLNIPADGKDSIVIEFLPKENKEYTASLVVRSNDTDPARRRIEVDMSGLGEGTTSVENLIEGLAVSYHNHNLTINLDNKNIHNIKAEFFNLNGTLLFNRSIAVTNGVNQIGITGVENNQVVFFKLTSNGNLIGTGKFINN